MNPSLTKTPEVISSLQNPRIKGLVKLRDRKAREEAGVMLIEGGREIMRALAAGIKVEECYHCPDEASNFAPLILAKIGFGKVFQVPKSVFSKIAMRESSDGIIVVAKRSRSSLIESSFKPNPLFMAVEGVEKPGNLGAILRTADAIGVDGVIVLDEQCDVYSPNVIRASIGAVFHVPVFEATQAELAVFKSSHNLKVFGAALADRAIDYTVADYRAGCIILCGSESQGLSPYWLGSSDTLIKIPMLGVGDSLNVSVAAAAIAFEAARQRGSK